MKESTRFGSIMLEATFRYMVPFIMLYGLYVWVHGEYSPGGGFQAGAPLAVGILLSRLIYGEDAAWNVSGRTATIVAGLGAFIFAGVGFLATFFSGHILDYGALPIPIAESDLRAYGILTIEFGVTLCVAGVIIAIYDVLSREEESL